MPKKIKDPFADREAENYSNPIPSREYILELLEGSSGPLSIAELSHQLSIKDEEQADALRRRLRAMERDGQIISDRRGCYGCIDKMQLVKGRVQGHRDGFGYLIPADGSDDVYLTHRQMRKVFHGDEVLVRPGPKDFRGKSEGKIVEVLAHNTTELVGRYNNEHGNHYVQPDNPRVSHDVLIAPEDVGGASHGQFVVVEITQQPSRYQHPVGKITKVVGNHLAPGMEIEVAIHSHGIPHQWPKAVEKSVEKYTREVSDKDKSHRIDLRKLPLVTIDGEDARDFDDAVYCEVKPSGGWRLFVAIADVSHYVLQNDALDEEASKRGNSVYFPDYVIPMLPEVLSNGLCSLNPLVDRLCMVCEMTVSETGRISGYKFYEGVMHSHARLTYTDVGKIVAEQNKKNSGVRKQYQYIIEQIDQLYAMYVALRKTREERGAIDFETTETRIIFDRDRKIEQIVPVQRNEAHKIIEECMLAANVCAAKFLEHLEIPSLYRVHEKPREEKLDVLLNYLAELGIHMRGDNITPADYREVMEKISGRPDANIIQTVMLRSMNQAVYQSENLGHFGLAYSAYTHFTSPIRRYPDLMVHRAIRAVIKSNMETKKVKRTALSGNKNFSQLYRYSPADLAAIGEICSNTERRADDATRDVISWLKCEFLHDRVGEVYDGVVSSVVGFGLFVELQDLYIEGLVHITSLPHDYYHFDAGRHRLVGERSGREFGLGDQVTVRIAGVSLEERKIDFELEDFKPRRRSKGTQSKQHKKQNNDVSQRKPRKRKIASSSVKQSPAKSTNKKASKKKKPKKR